MNDTKQVSLEKGKRFRSCREQLGKNLLFISWRTGLSESTISQAERGFMTLRTEKALSDYFSTTFADAWEEHGGF